MITEYKVVKPFGPLKVGNTLTLEDNMYVFAYETDSEKSSYYSCVHFEISKEVAESYCKNGFIEPITNEESTVDTCNDCKKIKEIKELISQLKNTYNQRKENIEKKYNDGKIQTCVKVEHDTVYFNLMKLLDKLETIINE